MKQSHDCDDLEDNKRHERERGTSEGARDAKEGERESGNWLHFVAQLPLSSFSVAFLPLACCSEQATADHAASAVTVSLTRHASVCRCVCAGESSAFCLLLMKPLTYIDFLCECLSVCMAVYVCVWL